LGHLALVIGLDAPRRGLQRRNRFRRHLGDGRGDLGLGDVQLVGGELHAVEAVGVVDEGRIAAALHVLDDGGDDRVDIGRRLLACGQQGAEGGLETGVADVDPPRPRYPVTWHCATPQGPRPPRKTHSSPLRKRGSRATSAHLPWMPAYAGMTEGGGHAARATSAMRSIHGATSAWRVLNAARLTISREVTSAMCSTSTRPLAFKVAPVDTR